MAFDDRVGPAAVSCYMSTLENILNSRREFDDGCQHLAGEGAALFDRPDYMIMREPRPTLILAGTRDRSFPIQDTRNAFADAKRFFDLKGSANRLAMVEGDHGHGIKKPLREAGARWMRRWLLDDGDPVTEGAITVQEGASFSATRAGKDGGDWKKALLSPALQVTKTGQVGSNWENSLLVPDLNLRRAKELAPARARFRRENSPEDCRKTIRRLIGLPEIEAAPAVVKVGTVSRSGYRIDKIRITRRNEIDLPGLLFIPSDTSKARPAVIYAHGDGKAVDAQRGGPIESLVNKGRIGLAIDLRGTGETKTTRRYRYASYMYTEDYTNPMLSLHLERPILGQRVGEILAALDVLAGHEQADPADISLQAVGAAGPVSLHAAALDSRIASLTITNSLTSWIDLLEAPLASEALAHVVPSALKYYDLPDLVKAIAPRPVHGIEIERSTEALSADRGEKGDRESAGINRLGVENERVLRERFSRPFRP